MTKVNCHLVCLLRGTDSMQSPSMTILNGTTIILASLNSCLNPILYVFLKPQKRSELFQLLRLKSKSFETWRWKPDKVTVSVVYQEICSLGHILCALATWELNLHPCINKKQATCRLDRIYFATCWNPSTPTHCVWSKEIIYSSDGFALLKAPSSLSPSLSARRLFLFGRLHSAR